MVVGIQYLTYQQIDLQKWDACITGANNGLIYGYSFYLDCMATHWDALVLNDYEAVMPLTWNKKYGIYYLYQPFLTASLGVFGNHITPGLVNDFLQAVPKKFKYWDIYLNHTNRFPLPHFALYDRVNYVLPLNEPYNKLYDRFRLNHKQSIKKAEHLKCEVRRNIDVADVIALAQEQGKAFPGQKRKITTVLKNSTTIYNTNKKPSPMVFIWLRANWWHPAFYFSPTKGPIIF